MKERTLDLTGTVTMAHGSGGTETATLIRSVFAPHLKSPQLSLMEDAAILNTSGRLAFSTDSFVITPVEFPGGDIGKLAVCGTVNDLVCMGAKPLALSAGFILQEGLPLTQLERIAASMAKAAKEAGVRIAAADTKVVEGPGDGSTPGLYINTSGIGTIHPGRNIRARGAKPGDAVLVSGVLGDHQAAITACRMGVESTLRSDCAPLGGLVSRLLEQGIRIRAMRDITRGGLATILNEVCHSSGVACTLQETALPVSPEAAAFCGILGLDPLYMANEGKLLLVVPEKDAEKAVQLMHGHVYGKGAVRIGTIHEGKGVSLQTQWGGQRRVDELQGEGLPRIC